MLVLLFGVIPTVFGIVFELYIALPGRYGLDKTATPILHLWDAWWVLDDGDVADVSGLSAQFPYPCFQGLSGLA
jgi:hypothetical protein